MTDGREPWRSAPLLEWAGRLCDSFRHWTGRELVGADSGAEQRADALFNLPAVVVSHGLEADPLLNYGNRAALRLWELEWRELIGMPSRLTAETPNRDTRTRALQAVERDGFMTDYAGIRISARGRRFRISGAVIWNVIDRHGDRLGQAATFSNWEYLGDGTPP